MSKVSIELSASARNGVSRILQSIANSRQSELPWIKDCSKGIPKY